MSYKTMLSKKDFIAAATGSFSSPIQQHQHHSHPHHPHYFSSHAAETSRLEKLKEVLATEKRDFEIRWLGPPSQATVASANDAATRTVADLSCLRSLGRGAFGHVILVKYKPDDGKYALKVLRKQLVVQRKQIRNVINEKKILACCKFPFVLKFAFSFKDCANLYLGLEFLDGGEFFYYLRRQKRLKEDDGRFYAAQMVLAIVYLHSVDVVHRDIKPENILFDRDGYIRLADFGFAKRLRPHERTWTFCGTPEYVAPEIIKNKGYNRAVDWWAFGILIYEMCAGLPPFNHDDKLKLYDYIVGCEYGFPSSFSRDLRHLIDNLLQPDLSRRFGNLKNGVKDIMQSKWLRATNWDGLLAKQVKPPYLPPDDMDKLFCPDKSTPVIEAPKPGAKDEYTQEFADF